MPNSINTAIPRPTNLEQPSASTKVSKRGDVRAATERTPLLLNNVAARRMGARLDHLSDQRYNEAAARGGAKGAVTGATAGSFGGPILGAVFGAGGAAIGGLVSLANAISSDEEPNQNPNQAGKNVLNTCANTINNEASQYGTMPPSPMSLSTAALSASGLVHDKQKIYSDVSRDYLKESESESIPSNALVPDGALAPQNAERAQYKPIL